jgi:Domain of unknown function (DUF4190)
MATATAQRDRDAEAALVLGVFGFVAVPIVPALFAIWLGVVSRRRIRSDPGLTGERLATAGIVLGVVELVTATVLIAVLIVSPGTLPG